MVWTFNRSIFRSENRFLPKLSFPLGIFSSSTEKMVQENSLFNDGWFPLVFLILQNQKKRYQMLINKKYEFFALSFGSLYLIYIAFYITINTSNLLALNFLKETVNHHFIVIAKVCMKMQEIPTISLIRPCFSSQYILLW